MIYAARIFFVLYLGLIALCIYRAFDGRTAYYWIAAALVYIMSMLFAWSIGGLTVGLAFALAGAGTALLLRRTAPRHQLAGASVGTLIWILWLFFGDITWVFLPVAWPFS